MLLDQLSIHAWIQNNGIKVESGQELDFHTHRYLFDIYRDNSKYLCCTKAGQIGFSTMAILKTIWMTQYQKLDVGYILPTVEMVQKFVGSKVNRMAQQNPVIQRAMADKDSITQKQIGENYIHYLGAMTERSAIMLSLDMLVADEYDKAPQEILETYDSRLQHSKHGYKWVFSNPTLPDFGVDRFWQISDQKKWHIQHACGKVFCMDESCIDYESEVFRCPHCKGEITDEERRMGEWYDKQGNLWDGTVKVTEWSGWWIPLWINPMMSAKKICEYKRTKTKEYFANFVAGLPYANSTDALSQATLVKNLTDEVNTREGRTIIGMDTGHNIHYTMMNKQGLFYNGYCKSVDENLRDGGRVDYDPYSEIERRLIEDKTAILVSDQGGDLIGIRKLQAKYPGRVFLCWFTKETKTKELIRWGQDEEAGKVLADRNRVIQMAVDQINELRLAINGTVEDWQPFFDHALNIYRVREFQGDENDPQYGWRWVWKRKGPDHLFLSLCYALIGFDKYSEQEAQIIGRDKFMQGVQTGSAESGIITGRRLGVKVDF